MSRGTPARSDASGSGFQGQGALFGRDPKKVFVLVAKSLFGEEPEKQRPAVPLDAGETPSACPIQRETTNYECLKTNLSNSAH